MSMTVNGKSQKWQILNATTLKLFAVVLMFLDHVHEMFVSMGAPMWLTMAGRLVFPIFLFAASESFHYTHSKKKYMQRLLFASVLMSLFTMVLQFVLPNPNVVLINNAFSTFFVTSVYMLFWDWLQDGITQKSPKKILNAVLLFMVPILCAVPAYLVALLSFNRSVPSYVIRALANIALMIPNILTLEGGITLVVLGFLFYVFRKHRILQIVILLALSAVVYLSGDPIQSLMALAAIPIALYNGERGKGLKNFFYIFYPTHIGILYILSSLISR